MMQEDAVKSPSAAVQLLCCLQWMGVVFLVPLPPPRGHSPPVKKQRRQKLLLQWRRREQQARVHVYLCVHVALCAGSWMWGT